MPDADSSSVAASPVARLTQARADVEFPRTLQADRQVEAFVATTRDADAHVVSARLVSPLFADSPPRDVVVRLYPDWVKRVRLPLGTAVCPAPQGESHVELTLIVDGVTTVETLTATGDALRAVNADECAQQAVFGAAQPSFGPVESHTGGEVRTSIVLTRGDASPEEPVTLGSMTGNIVFIVRLADGGRTLAPGEESLSVPAVVSVGRCDPHVFADGKKNFIFPAYLAMGDADPAYVEIRPDPATKAALQALMDACGEAQREGGGAA